MFGQMVKSPHRYQTKHRPQSHLAVNSVFRVISSNVYSKSPSSNVNLWFLVVNANKIYKNTITHRFVKTAFLLHHGHKN